MPSPWPLHLYNLQINNHFQANSYNQIITYLMSFICQPAFLVQVSASESWKTKAFDFFHLNGAQKWDVLYTQWFWLLTESGFRGKLHDVKSCNWNTGAIFPQDYLHRYHRLKTSPVLNRSFFHWEIDIKVFY